MTEQRPAWPTGIEVGCALVVAAIAFLIGWNATDQARTYQVRTQIAIVPSAAQTPEQAASFMNSPIPPEEVQIIVYLLRQPQTRQTAAQLAGTNPDSTSVTVEIVEKTPLIVVTAGAPTPESADRILTAVIDRVRSKDTGVNGIVEVVTTQPNEQIGSGGNPVRMPVLIVLTLAGLLAGAALAHILCPRFIGPRNPSSTVGSLTAHPRRVGPGTTTGPPSVSIPSKRSAPRHGGAGVASPDHHQGRTDNR